MIAASDQVRAPTSPAATPGRRWLRRLGVAAAILIGVALLAGGVGLLAFRAAVAEMGPPPLAAAEAMSTVVLDRNERLLRAFTTPEGRWRLPVAVVDVHPRYLAMLLAFEDRRFRWHDGVDPVAVLRATWQAVWNGRLVSGGSTLTMQVARLLEGRHERTGLGKLRQMVRALQIEQRLSKNEILRLYLELAPFGGNLEGVRAASLAYFGKEPLRLSVGEAALLVALPQAPGLRRPDQFPENARRARDRVLARALEAGVITPAEAERARSERIPTRRQAFPQLAAHLAEAEVARRPTLRTHHLTIDAGLQAKLETLAAERALAAGPRLSVGMIVVDHTSGEVLAHVGSPGYLDGSRFGSIDMVRAIRSPGSTLKPFIYGLAFDQGLVHPETLIEDVPVRYGRYAPKNFDDVFHGTVSIREALQLSLNVPAVKVLSSVGPSRLLHGLSQAGIEPSLPGDQVPSLAMALGGVGLSLADLSRLFSTIAEGGVAVELHVRKEDAAAGPLPAAERRRVLGRVAAWYVADILRGTPPPRNARTGQIAYKTGTSYGYRDAWAAGFDGRHTIGVWIGRPDGVATPGLTGLTSAAPILFDAFARIGVKRAPFPGAPSGTVQSAQADLPPPLRRFRADVADDPPEGPFADPPLQIAFPPDQSELELPAATRPLVLKAEGGVLPLTWMVNGVPIGSDAHRREVEFRPDGLGFVKLSVVDAKGRVDRVTIRLQ